jgi:hypothetical protein
MLERKISKYSDDTYLDLLNKLFLIFNSWLLKQKELIVIDDLNELKVSFFHLIINKKNTFQNYYDDYSTCKYSENMVDLFLEMKNAAGNYGSDILEQDITSDNLLYFLQYHTFVDDNIDNENQEDINEELNEYEFI